MKPDPHVKDTTMYFAEIENPFGTSLFTAPTAAKVKPHKLPRTKRGTRARRNPMAPTTILKNVLLNYNG